MYVYIYRVRNNICMHSYEEKKYYTVYFIKPFLISKAAYLPLNIARVAKL